MLNRLLLISIISFALWSCEQSTTVTLQWQLTGNESTQLCDQATSTWQKIDFFAYDFTLYDKQGNAFKLNQLDHYGLSFISVNCDRLEAITELQAPTMPAAIRSLEFTIGVPFALNHANPVTLEYPLNQPDTFWVWQTGHKFFQAEGRYQQHNRVFHLGSTGCLADSALRSPNQQCRQPNRHKLSIPINQSSTTELQIAIDPNALFKSLPQAQALHCQSEPNNKLCSIIVNNLTQNSHSKLFRQL
ncbi:MAG: metallo-mystery pair system four-Cys motif protein [Gammaproteobacteria bacterium]|nr:metallo-mystery pair system four-Cys motif protein [Gammaproteobacteria bacterium]NVK88088.1 metallo-mystery pair system four-Cys motif protein [Gammaproteobacteria bacterium]